MVRTVRFQILVRYHGHFRLIFSWCESAIRNLTLATKKSVSRVCNNHVPMCPVRSSDAASSSCRLLASIVRRRCARFDANHGSRANFGYSLNAQKSHFQCKNTWGLSVQSVFVIILGFKGHEVIDLIRMKTFFGSTNGPFCGCFESVFYFSCHFTGINR